MLTTTMMTRMTRTSMTAYRTLLAANLRQLVTCNAILPITNLNSNRLFVSPNYYNYQKTLSSSSSSSTNSSRPTELKAKFESNQPRMSPRLKLKNLVALYGPTAIVLHIGLSLTFLGVTYLIVRYGFDVPAFLQRHEIANEKYLMIIANGGTFGLAYAVYKMMMPFRVIVTLALTPIVARTLQTYGIIKRKF